MAGAVLSESALVLRWTGAADEGDRLLLLNLGTELRLDPCPEPLLAPKPGTFWRPLLSSEETRFGGTGAAIPDGTGPWWIPGLCAQVLGSSETS
jgi:maltooligosyltrehalose trehalohydrolase